MNKPMNRLSTGDVEGMLYAFYDAIKPTKQEEEAQQAHYNAVLAENHARLEAILRENNA
jgi:hypothetical protein